MKILTLLILAMAATITGSYFVAGTDIQASSPPDSASDLTTAGATSVNPETAGSGYTPTGGAESAGALGKSDATPSDLIAAP